MSKTEVSLLAADLGSEVPLLLLCPLLAASPHSRVEVLQV